MLLTGDPSPNVACIQGGGDTALYGPSLSCQRAEPRHGPDDGLITFRDYLPALLRALPVPPALPGAIPPPHRRGRTSSLSLGTRTPRGPQLSQWQLPAGPRGAAGRAQGKVLFLQTG